MKVYNKIEGGSNEELGNISLCDTGLGGLGKTGGIS